MATVYSSSLYGVTPLPVEVEIDISTGQPFFQIVGLPDSILKESKTRVKSAIVQSGFSFPHDERLVLNLAPSKIKKEGSAMEMAIALRILIAMGQVQIPWESVLCLGELGLDGTVKAVPEQEALAFSSGAIIGLQALLIPLGSRLRRPLGYDGPIYEISNLKEFTEADWWMGREAKLVEPQLLEYWPKVSSSLKVSTVWAELLKIAVIGDHHFFLCGPPGSGKSFFAETLRIMKRFVYKSDRSTRILDAVFGRSNEELPWSSPHHSVSVAGLIGGGNPIRPGAATRAHGGILFLDELLEFSPQALDSLREPIEKGVIDLFRANTSVCFPSRIQLIAATNPCRCGYWGHPTRPCICLPKHRQGYQSRMSGPFMDRFDLRLFCKVDLNIVNGIPLERVAENIRTVLKHYKPSIDLEFDTSAQSEFEKLESRILSIRTMGKIRSLSKTLARIDLESEIRPKHVKRAAQFQRIMELEPKF